MSRGNLVLVISGLDGGGAARVITELAADLDRAGYKVTLLTLEGEGDPDVFPIPERIRRRRIQLMWSTTGFINKLISTIRRLRILRTALLEESPDAIISFIDTTNVRVLAATIFCDVPVIVSERTDPRHHKIGKVWNALRFLFYRRATHIVVQTERVAAWMRRRHGLKTPISVIPNAVRGGRELEPVSRETNVNECHIVAVGRLVASKRFDLLIEAFAEANLRASGCTVTIVGTGPEKAFLLARIKELHLEQCVRLPGHCDDVQTFLQSGDIFVLSSEYEGFPNALLEAMQLGLACISADCESGPAELISDSLNGLLVPVGDRTSLASAMRQLAFDPDMRQTLGAAATYVCKTYHPDAVATRWMTLLPNRSTEKSPSLRKADSR